MILTYWENALLAKANAKSILGASLLAWWRADLGVTLNGSTVSAWADQSGTGDANKNAVQAAGALQPTFVASNAGYGGRPTINFPGSTLLQTGVWAVACAQPFTRFVVCNTTLAASKYIMDSLTGLQSYLLDSSGTNVNFAMHTPALAAGVGLMNTPSIVVGVNDGASSSIAVRQNTPQASGNAGADASCSGFTLGCFNGGGNFSLNGDMAECIVASGHVTNLKIAQMTANLAAYYGLTQGA